MHKSGVSLAVALPCDVCGAADVQPYLLRSDCNFSINDRHKLSDIFLENNEKIETKKTFLSQFSITLSSSSFFHAIFVFYFTEISLSLLMEKKTYQ